MEPRNRASRRQASLSEQHDAVVETTDGKHLLVGETLHGAEIVQRTMEMLYPEEGTVATGIGAGSGARQGVTGSHRRTPGAAVIDAAVDARAFTVQYRSVERPPGGIRSRA